MANQAGNEAVSAAFSRPALVETGKVFLSNLSTDASKDMLEEMFKKFGDIQSIYVSLSDPPGFGFVTYKGRKCATDAAKALDGHVIGHLAMHVEPAYEAPKLPTPRHSFALMEPGSSLLGNIEMVREMSEESQVTTSNKSAVSRRTSRVTGGSNSGEESGVDSSQTEGTHTGSAFIEAVAKGDATAVRHALEDMQIDPDEKRRYQARSALHLACGYGQKDVAEQLLQAGADPNQVSHVGRTPLHEACQGGHVDVLCLILDYTRSIINAGDQEGQSPAHMAAFHGEVDCLEVLTARGASLVMEDRFGRQPAHLAAMRNHSNVLEFLYEKGVELECPCDQGKLPLHYAAQHGALDSLVCLTERDCDITIGDNVGNLPIHCAAYNDNLDCLRFLVKQGSSREATQVDGKTPAHVAAAHGSLKVLHWLMEKGVDPDIKDGSGNTPCHYAASSGKARCFNCLQRHGASLEAENDQEETPLHAAKRSGHSLLIEKAVKNETNCKQCLSHHEFNSWQSAHPAPHVMHSVSRLAKTAYNNPVPKLKSAAGRRPLYRSHGQKGPRHDGKSGVPHRDLAAKYFGEYLQDDLLKGKHVH